MKDLSKVQNKSQYGPIARDPDARSPDTLRSIMRLMIGGVLVGVDELLRRLPEWERGTDAALGYASRELSEKVGVPHEEEEKTQPAAPDALFDQTRHVLVGLAFESQTYLKKGAETLGSLERTAWKLATPVHRPLGRWRVFAPARRRYQRLVKRGEKEVNRWVELGRAEERRSRTLARAALGSTVFESIGQVVEDPRLQDVIQERAVTLSGEVAGSVRERTVSADTLIESVARRLFRRSPHEFPSEPPVTIYPPKRAKGA